MNLFLEISVLLITVIYSYLEALVKLFIPAKRKSIGAEIILITGAGHGIGRATAFEFAKHQSTLVLWDINKHGVEETADECRRLGSTVHTFVVNCSKREDIYSTAEKVKKNIGDVTILVNNAGVVSCADLLSLQDHQVQNTFDVNILAHFWTSKAFLPAMMRNDHGHVVTVASTAGHIGFEYLVDYCSSKFAAVGYHKALTAELSALGKYGIKTSCLCPVFVNTGFVKNPSTRLMPVLKPETVARKLLDGILTNKKMIFVPSSVNIFLFLNLFLPERALVALNKLQDLKFDAVVHGGKED
uniref:17beta-estradiol 17-dehydrogenase n=1 Tax=Geotrypetes seraphini TaxID=260995 RepID=A0A6P8QCE4_GEOSA|nr:17-beta-hydroxysteroid dehydrogenase 13-like [Geotrypetes seraphini]